MIDASNQECDLPRRVSSTRVFIEVFKHLGQQLLDCRIVAQKHEKPIPYIWINQIPFGLERYDETSHEKFFIHYP